MGVNWGRRSHHGPATTLHEQSQHLKLCTAAEQVKEKQVEVSSRSWEQCKWKREGKVIWKHTNEGFRFDMLRVVVFHLANHKDNDVPLYLFIWVLECQEIIVIFGEIFRNKTFVPLYLFHFPGMQGKGLNVFLSKVLLNGKIQNDKVLDYENMIIQNWCDWTS